MPLPDFLQGRLSIPAVAAPMFLVSGPELVTASCKAGIVGSFPTLNARPIELLDEWLSQINDEVARLHDENPDTPVAPYAVNLIVHRTNPRLQEDLELCVRHRVPIVITSVGKPEKEVAAVHDYGGFVFHDVTNAYHARKALEVGVDGLILVCAGAGGHAGLISPFSLVPHVREFWDGPLILAGAISDGRAIRAAEVLGADLAYLGTRLIATKEAAAQPEYKQMIIDSTSDDLIYTNAFSGINANMLKPSIERAGLDPETLVAKKAVDMASATGANSARAWMDIWSAGQGVSVIHDQPPVAELVARLREEYDAACNLG